jgi:hypothetical protein
MYSVSSGTTTVALCVLGSAFFAPLNAILNKAGLAGGAILGIVIRAGAVLFDSLGDSRRYWETSGGSCYPMR